MLVYIREAHALDSSWPAGGGRHPVVEDPVTLQERLTVATTCVERLDLAPMPTVVDGMDDRVSQSYGAWPERLYLIAKGGEVAYRGGPGPFEFDPDGLAAAIEALP